MSGAQVRQVKLYIDNSSSQFSQLISSGSSTITFPAATGVATIMGNTFNGANQLVQLNGSTQYPGVSGVLIPSLNASNVGSGLLGVTYGGTHVGTYTVGDILYASDATTLTRLPRGPAGTILHGGGSGAPIYASIDLASSDIGASVLKVSNGGTLQNSQGAALNAILPSQLGNGSKFLQTSGANTVWTTQPAVTSVTAGSGLTSSPNPIVTTGTVSINFTSDDTWTGTHTFAPSSDKTCVTIQGASGGTHDILDIENSTGLTKYLSIDNTGVTTMAALMIAGGFSKNTLTALSTSNGVTIGTGSNATILSSNASGSAKSISLPDVSGTVQLAGASESAQSNTSNPTGTTSTTGVMMGLGGANTFTPLLSGRILIFVTGTEYNTAGGQGGVIQIRYGTGAAPANGAAPTGSVGGPIVTGQPDGAGHTETIPMASVVVVSGLTIGTTYWVDVTLASTGSGTTSLSDATITTVEL